MTKEQIAELRRLELKALSDWRQGQENVYCSIVADDQDGTVVHIADAAFDGGLIIAARNALPKLLDEREALLEAVRTALAADGYQPLPRESHEALQAAIAKAEAE